MRILYLHGFASGPLSGKAQFFRDRFAEAGVELEIPDLVEGDFEQLTISGQLRVVERTAAGDRIALIGSSMGGYLAALYASLHPEVSNVVLLAPAFRFPQRWPDDLGPIKTAEWQRTGRLEVFHYGEARLRYIGWQLIEDGRKYPPFPDFRQPGLIFHGTADAVVSPSFSEEFAAGHPNVILRLVNSDHQLTDVTGEMWREIRPFLLGERSHP
jgi:pimeloyl-ACP methyl ester carboxylesterase